MHKLIKYILFFFFSVFFLFSIYLLKLRLLAIETDNLYALRCTETNLPLIAYKKAFLNFAYCLQNSDQCADDEVYNYYQAYIQGAREYIPKENEWLKRQQKLIERLDFQFFMLPLIQTAAEYEWKMYEAYRDDAQMIIDILDKDLDVHADSLQNNNDQIKFRKYQNQRLYHETLDLISDSPDLRLFILNLPLPSQCNDDNLYIPETVNAIDWDGKDASKSAVPIDINEIKGPLS